MVKVEYHKERTYKISFEISGKALYDSIPLIKFHIKDVISYWFNRRSALYCNNDDVYTQVKKLKIERIK